MNDLAEKLAVEKTAARLSRKDFQTSQEVRWCPGCGDYAILAQFQKLLADVGAAPEEHVIVSGIGCASRFPYYVNTYGVHGIHGRAPALATGIKAANPRLTVWVVTGDGDALSIGASHLLHVLRRNVDVKVLLFNNRVYGLTKGQYSPTSPAGQHSKSTPGGSVDYPLEPVRVALGAEASFVARSMDSDGKHLQRTLRAAYEHRGSVFVEILQNCPIFNDGAFADAAGQGALELEDGAPLVFGGAEPRGLALGSGLELEVVPADSPRVLRHDAASLPLANLLADLGAPDHPLALGVFRRVHRPTHDQLLRGRRSVDRRGLQQLLEAGATWRVE